MNIKKAKEEIKYAIQAYLAKDEFGEYRIPAVRQRPVLLMGAPGIGKTAVMEQVARECGVALVSYSITHHTRQSAIGLPFISKKEYGGKEYTVTEYTMSEIIASVYDKMEETGLQEGILFIDEINCASETLAPAMLQFLQCKTFGAHKVPEGWLIAAAGNPPEYNKSVREFDVVTLDRVKKIDVEPDFSVWKEYAYKQGIHGAILSYLEIRKDHFYAMETTVDGKRFVTARGWEDLSTILKVYEDMNLPVEEGLIYQYLQHRRIAKDFANYLDLYRKYRTDYRVDDILQGKYTKQAVTKLQDAPFDTKVEIVENGVHYMVDVEDGQKTGFFLDQKNNRAAIHRFCKDKKVLDCFTHTGSFALNAGIAGAKSVLGVDASQLAVDQATENAKLNGLENTVSFRCADVFELLPELEAQGEKYDVVILDPPAFTKSRNSIKNAVKGYREINLRGLKLVKDGGFLVTCSCSHFMDPELFAKTIREASHGAHKRLRQVEFKTQGPDHPILWAADESYYLKFYIFQVVDEK